MGWSVPERVASFGLPLAAKALVAQDSKRALRAGLQRLATHCNGTLAVGTACSGTDLIVPVLTSLAEHWKRFIGLDIKIEHVFSCENLSWKVEFLTENVKPKFIFCDARNLASGAKDVLAEELPCVGPRGADAVFGATL